MASPPPLSALALHGSGACSCSAPSYTVSFSLASLSAASFRAQIWRFPWSWGQARAGAGLTRLRRRWRLAPRPDCWKLSAVEAGRGSTSATSSSRRMKMTTVRLTSLGPRYRRRLPRPTSPSGARRLPPGPSAGEPVAAPDTATAGQAGGLRASWPLLAALTLSRRGGRQ